MAAILVAVAPCALAAPTVSILTPSSSTATTPANFTLTAKATSSGGATIASVQYFVNGKPLGSPLAASPYRYAWTNVGTGAYILTAKATDSRSATATSGPVVIAVLPPIPKVSITSPANNSNFTKGVTISLQATASVNGDTISKVQFYDGVKLLGSGTGSGSTYTFNWVTASAATGTHAITAAATGALGGINISNTVKINITTTAPLPAVSITSPGNNSSFTQGASVALTASATISGDTISSVQFYDGATLLGSGTASGSTYTFNWATATAATGAHSITARASGTLGGTATSSAITVNIAALPVPSVSITSPANNSSFTQGATVALTASATISGDTISSVQFYDGATLLGSGTASGSTDTFNWATATAATGAHSITAKASGTLGGTATSSAITVNIAALPVPSVSITSPANNSSFTQGAPVALTASATISGDTISSVQFYDGATLLGSGIASGSTYTFNWATAAVTTGAHTITAKASGTLGGTATSSPVAINIMADVAPTLNILTPSNGATAAAPASFTLTASATPGLSGETISSVQYYVNGSPIGTPLAASPYAYGWSNVAAGSYTLSAVAIDNFGTSGTSNSITVVVTASTAAPAGLYYVYVDQINTPRVITRPSDNQVAWRWDGADPFGSSAPNTNPAGIGTFTYNPRFPGQLYDVETGLNYNVNRNYDPLIGRYVQSDPIGLNAGVNPYVYVNANPVGSTDALGLATCALAFVGDQAYLSCLPSDPSNSPVGFLVSSGNNGNGMKCKNNPKCEDIKNHGPIPRGCWRWTGDKSSHQGRYLVPCDGQSNHGRTDLLTHSCDNPFGPDATYPFCSEGCVTATAADIQRLNQLLDSEPGSTVSVTGDSP